MVSRVAENTDSLTGALNKQDWKQGSGGRKSGNGELFPFDIRGKS